MMKKVQKGFTLIELMIVVAIIGILAAVAIPAYQDYIARAQVSEAVTLLGGAKTPMAEFYADNGAFPTSPSAIIPNVRGTYVSLITYDAAPGTAATVELIAIMKATGVNAGIRNGRLEMGTTDGGNTWTCTPGDTSPLADKYLPNACK
ncbi:MAG TPA: pilin [Gammaproteobacteria bacterium]